MYSIVKFSAPYYINNAENKVVFVHFLKSLIKYLKCFMASIHVYLVDKHTIAAKYSLPLMLTNNGQ